MPIGPGKAAAFLEAFNAAADFLEPGKPHPNLKGDFIAIGGAALLSLGNTRDIADLDVAINAAALDLFDIKAAQNPDRFKKTAAGEWVYKGQQPGTKDIEVPFEFLDIGGEFVRKIGPIKAMGNGFRATLGELANMKAAKYHDTGDEKDLNDFKFILTKMHTMEEGFSGVYEMTVDEVKQMATCAKLTNQINILQEYLAKVNRGLDGSGPILPWPTRH